VQLDGDARDLPVAVALGELLLHARDVHHRRRPRPPAPSPRVAPTPPPSPPWRAGGARWELGRRVEIEEGRKEGDGTEERERERERSGNGSRHAANNPGH
jgi:hypothetical protein